MSTTLVTINPILNSRDVRADIEWYEKYTGFVCTFDSDSYESSEILNYAVLKRQNIFIHLQWHAGTTEDPLLPCSIRIQVKNIRPLFEEFVERGTVKPERFLEKTAWGTREFGFHDLNKNAVFIYEDL